MVLKEATPHEILQFIIKTFQLVYMDDYDHFTYLVSEGLRARVLNLW